MKGVDKQGWFWISACEFTRTITIYGGARVDGAQWWGKFMKDLEASGGESRIRRNYQKDDII